MAKERKLKKSKKRKQEKSTGNAVSIFLQQIRKYPLLDDEAVAWLCGSAQELEQYNEQVEEFNRKIDEAVKEGKKVKTKKKKKQENWPAQKMVQHNLRLVVSVIKRFFKGFSGNKQKRPRFLEFMDLVQAGAGDKGLYKAVLRFDPSRGNKFSTYAVWWIRHAISREIADRKGTVKHPVHLQDAQKRLNRVLGHYSALGIEIGDDLRLHSLKGRTVGRLKAGTAGADRQPLSFDQMVSASGRGFDDDSDLSLHNLLPDEATPPPDARAELLGGLTHNFDDPMSGIDFWMDKAKCDLEEREILFRRFGIDEEREHTLQEIADDFGLSRERIRQIEARSIAKLRRVFARDIAER